MMRQLSRRRNALILFAVLLMMTAVTASARSVIAPSVTTHDIVSAETIARFDADPIDISSALIDDIAREREGLPLRFAIPQETFITPETHGTWEELDGSMLVWRVRIQSPGALSLNLGFTEFSMPQASHMSIYPTDNSAAPVTFTSTDNKDHRELWTPVVSTSDLMVEIVLPVKERWNLGLELTSVNPGYKRFATLATNALGEKQGSCNNDVVCAVGDPWRDSIHSVGAYSTGGSLFCTGAMINNTSNDETPYFLTANHCGISTANDQSLVVYWNFESVNCGDLSGGSLADFQTGSTHRASNSASDMTLVELDNLPALAHEVSYAGWDRTGVDATSAVAIHHPNVDEKAISFENDPTTVTTYLQNAIPGDGTHVRITNWDDGTTEPGSSGSPLFDQNHRIIGQLHGGYASCTSATSDWYGRIYTSWTGGGSSSSRLSDWLDTAGTGDMTTDVITPYASGMSTSPSSSLDTEGDVGGPFAPNSIIYTLQNNNEAGSLNYSVTSDQSWISITNGSGSIAYGATAAVTVSINSGANTLAQGTYSGTVTIQNTTDHSGDTTRQVNLVAGIAGMILSWDMSTDPGWTTAGLWAYGVPTGGGGEYGNPDPTSGATGANVYGYNLSGDYTNNMSETHLTTTAIDCTDISAASLKFQRWLNVETSTYDHAYVRVSNDGVNWTQLWANGGEVTDNSWTEYEYDISAIADGEAMVYVRWTQGTSDSSWLFSGWNIDDVAIWGFDNSTSGAGNVTPRSTRLMPNIPNPFNPMTEISFDLGRAGHARLSVYDLRGQLVKVLTDTELPVGTHTQRWDGTDATGRAVSSGSYLFRLEAANGVQVKKGLLVR